MHLAGPLAALTLLAGPPPMQEVDLRKVANDFGANAQLYLTKRGIELTIERQATLVLPLRGAQEVELEYEAAGPALLTYGHYDGDRTVKANAQGWRYRRLASGRGSLHLDLRLAPGFHGGTRPLLVLHGSGRFALTGLRHRPLPAGAEAVASGRDRALLWAPFPIDHSTINTLLPPMWKASPPVPAYALLGLAFLAVTAAVLAGLRVLRGAWRPRRALAVGALLAVGAGNALFLGKLLPALTLSVEPDPEARIRENYAFDPQAGALAALARATLRPDERVGVMTWSAEWFAPELLCFHLAPRPCVFARAGEQEHAGLSGVDRLRPDELDAIVWYESDDPLPPGFARVAELGPRAYVARRR